MRTRAYVQAERAIAAADTNTIRERWLYGLRLLHDPDAIAPAGGLKHGVAENLIAAAAKIGIVLSNREIQYRMKCARTYRTESQIRTASSDFETWTDLRNAGFPAYDPEPDEPDADHRTKAERDHANAQHLVDLVGDQGVLFPYDRFEPDESTLKDLVDYAAEMAELTERFAQRDRQRSEYLERLREAVGDDLSVLWEDAHRAAYGTEIDPGDATP